MSGALYNLHVHTPFSDGAYNIDELCEAHLSYQGLQIDGIGVCDHLFRTPSSREAASPRHFEQLFAEEARKYVAYVSEARRRWAGRMHVFCGCEINWTLNRAHLDVIRDLLAGMEMDYVLFEYADWAGLTQLANQARRWPCPVGLAHTNVARQMPSTSADQVVRTLANARIFYELNAKLLPLAAADEWFQTLPHHKVAISLGTDTHDDLDSIRQMGELYAFAQRRGLATKLLAPRLREEEPVLAAQPA